MQRPARALSPAFVIQCGSNFRGVRIQLDHGAQHRPAVVQSGNTRQQAIYQLNGG